MTPRALGARIAAFRRHLIRAAALYVMLLAPAAAPADVQPVVAPGNEERLADMLGRGVALEGSCKLTAGSVDGGSVKGTYACPGGEVVLELGEPSRARNPVAETEQFAITVLSGSPPAALLDALQARIRARESDFEWTWIGPPQALAPELAAQPTGPPQPAWALVGELFLALLSAGLLIALWHARESLRDRDAVILALLVALALVLRFIAHAGPSDIRAVLGDYNVARAGWGVMFHLVYRILPPIDDSIWNVNRVAGALAVPLLYAVMRHRFPDRIAAIGGAAALAVNPLLVRFSASDAPYILLSAAFLGALVAYDRFTESGSVWTLALALGLMTTAMQLRPETSWLLVPGTLMALARPPASWRALLWRRSVVVCALLFAAINAVVLAAAVVETGRRQGGYWDHFVLIAPVLGSPWGTPKMTPPSLTALVVIGVCAAALRYRRAALLWLAAVLLANPFAFPAVGPPHGQFANARYYIPSLYLACAFAGLGVAGLIRLGERLTRHAIAAPSLIAVCIVCIAAAPGFELLRRMWTPQREYEFFRSGIAQLDPECRVVAFAWTSDAGFIPFDYLVPDRVVDADRFLSEREDRCYIYYRAANCFSPNLVLEPERSNFTMNPTCRAIEQRFRLDPIVEAQLPVLPYRGESYARNPIPVGFYRLQALEPPAAGAPP